jgi:hypothetical protein
MDEVVAWVTIAGVATGLATLWLAYREVKKAVYIRLAERAETLMGRMIDIERVAVDHPELMPYLFEGRALAEDDPNRNAVLAYALLFVDFAETVGWQIRTGEMSSDGGRAWREYFVQLHDKTPAVQRVFARGASLYCDETKWLLGTMSSTAITRRWDAEGEKKRLRWPPPRRQPSKPRLAPPV